MTKDRRPAVEGGKPVRGDFLVFGSPRIEEAEIKEVEKTLRSGWIGTGPKVGRFESDFSKYCEAKYAMAVNSCTAALHLSMLVSGIKPGDEVITTPMTFCATANAIIHAGGHPVFVDVEKDTFNLDPTLIEAAITEKTKAIVPVHFAGRPCKMDEILKIARKNDLFVIEDAAHAIEAKYKGEKVGTIGDLTCFSFYVTKNLVTGEGGMVTTNNKEYAEKIKVLALHGMTQDAWKRYSDEGFKHYQVVAPGYKYNMMDIQAALGIHQLQRVDSYLGRREEIWNKYNEAFKSLPVILPNEPEHNTVHGRHLYPLLLDIDSIKLTRDQLQKALFRENIGTGIHFISLHLHPFYADTFGLKNGDFPNAEFISERTISLPISAKLDSRDVDDVIEGVRKILEYYS